MANRVRVTLCVDALEHQLGGIGRYTWELASRLPFHEGIKSVSYFARSRLYDDPRILLAGAKKDSSSRIGRFAAGWSAGRKLRATIVHSPNYFLPQRACCGLITVHDLSVFRFPETHPAQRVHQFERLFTDSLNRASHIITDTETVRQEVLDAFSVDPGRVTAVPLGVSDQFKPAAADIAGPILRKWGLEYGGYGLTVSAVEPRKKVPELLTAWRGLPLRLRNSFPLVLAGGSGWMNQQIHDQVDLGVAEGWLRHLGHVDERQLPALYAGAKLFVYPSLYEGFGLPPIEAMASGVPVIVSDRSCLPEVCGTAARFVDPDNDNQFLNAIRFGLEDDQWREGAVRRGLERAACFTWDRCIQDTVKVYKSLDVH